MERLSSTNYLQTQLHSQVLTQNNHPFIVTISETLKVETYLISLRNRSTGEKFILNRFNMNRKDLCRTIHFTRINEKSIRKEHIKNYKV